MVRASCMLTDQVGDLVAIRTTVNGSIKVWRANPAQRNKMPAIGVIVKKWGTTDCIVQLQGPVLNIYSGLTPATVYMVGDNGRPTTSPPIPDEDEVRYVQHIGAPLTVQVLNLQPSMLMTLRHP